MAMASLSLSFSLSSRSEIRVSQSRAASRTSIVAQYLLVVRKQVGVGYVLHWIRDTRVRVVAVAVAVADVAEPSTSVR
jgi:hypothetical protein